MKPKTIKIDDIEYIQKDSIQEKAQDLDGLPCCIVRTYSAGVFYGYIKNRVGQEVHLINSRRMWQWYGASLSELAQSGTPDISKCKFPEIVDEILLLNAIEILYLTKKAKESLDSVKIWKA
jgi:hypothetical protein